MQVEHLELGWWCASGCKDEVTIRAVCSYDPSCSVVAALLVLCELLPLPLLELSELGLAERLELALLLLALCAVFGEFLQIQIDVSPGSPASQNARAALRFGHVRAGTREGLGKEGRRQGRQKEPLTALRDSTVTSRLLSVASERSVICAQRIAADSVSLGTRASGTWDEFATRVGWSGMGAFATYRLLRLLHHVLLRLLRVRGGHRRAPRALGTGRRTRAAVAEVPPPAVVRVRARVRVLLPRPRTAAPMAPAPTLPLIHCAGDGRVRGDVGVHLRRRRGRWRGAGGGVGVLGNAVAAAVAGLVPAVVVLVHVPPGRSGAAGDEPEEARDRAAATVHVVVVVHLRRYLREAVVREIATLGDRRMWR